MTLVRKLLGPFWSISKDITMLKMRETWVRSLGWEDALEEGMQPTLVLLSRESPWTEEPGGLQTMGLQSWTRLSD